MLSLLFTNREIASHSHLTPTTAHKNATNIYAHSSRDKAILINRLIFTRQMHKASRSPYNRQDFFNFCISISKFIPFASASAQRQALPASPGFGEKSCQTPNLPFGARIPKVWANARTCPVHAVLGCCVFARRYCPSRFFTLSHVVIFNRSSSLRA